MFADTLILPDKINFSNQILGSSLSLPAYGRVGQGQHFFLLAVHFAKRNTKNCGDERARARQQSPKIRILKIGGEGGIRTRGPLIRTTVFKTVPFNRSGTSPDYLRLTKIVAYGNSY